ncbi:glycolate oxidase subunit GlcE [Fulvimarina sp. 2208YS6-2-32]|uniref:Glycolate oxidase subunit GlcE n=1 Tax=Fulvimarina uroteuthidis TaxID=3098149 RepID=A0ABU5I1A3_9HYPH|nr:glycolate oxidase subunit GlcE [Fulvimarina sp. 2208YS6-2-32]MDY8108594.1 glycolate oxidase subunit GlcE [Fulvimarina sp. 2208YS6-2-32]
MSQHQDGARTDISGADARIFRPETKEQLREVVAGAVSEETPLLVEGTGSKSGLGRPVQAGATLSLSRLTGVTLYEPDELVLSARAGTPIADIEALVDSENQRLEFEPIDYGPLHGKPRGLGTIGGVVACNLAGPRRLKQGAARDHVLGVQAVSGRAEIFKSGGRVVKNVTGYDLSKGLTGSFGTLAVMSDITIKVLPKTEAETTLVLRGLMDEDAATAMARAMGSPAEASAAAHLPMLVARRVIDGALGDDAATVIRLDGFGPSVDARANHLGLVLERMGRLERLHGEESRALWRDIKDATPFADGTERPVWRVSVAPTKGHALVMGLRRHAAIDAFYDWQGGLVWLRMESGEPDADLVRAGVARIGGGHATLVRASEQIRAATQVFQPQAAALAGLSKRLKEQFDPGGVLNPGKMG